MNLKYIISIMLERALLWHKGGLAEWSVSDWGVSFGGEAGEVLDAIKKLRRLELGNRGANNPQSIEEAIQDIGEEVVDTFCYGILICLRLGIDFEKALVRKFNAVSQREGFPQRLELGHDSNELIAVKRAFLRGIRGRDKHEENGMVGKPEEYHSTPRTLHEQVYAYGWHMRQYQHALKRNNPRMYPLVEYPEV